jgi:hypothetical protein
MTWPMTTGIAVHQNEAIGEERALAIQVVGVLEAAFDNTGRE